MSAVIETEDLTKSYGTVLTVSNINLEIQEGEVFGYLVRIGRLEGEFTVAAAQAAPQPEPTAVATEPAAALAPTVVPVAAPAATASAGGGGSPVLIIVGGVVVVVLLVDVVFFIVRSRGSGPKPPAQTAGIQRVRM